MSALSVETDTARSLRHLLQIRPVAALGTLHRGGLVSALGTGQGEELLRRADERRRRALVERPSRVRRRAELRVPHLDAAGTTPDWLREDT